MTTTDTDAPNAATDTTATDTAAETTDWKAEAEKWQALARKHETRAEKNASAAKELDSVKQSAMTELERAVAEARAEGARAAGERIARAEIKAAAAGRPISDVDALLEGVDARRFLDDDGEPDTKAIGAWLDRVAPKGDSDERKPTPFPDLGQGPRGHTPTDPSAVFADFVSRQTRGG